MAEIVYSPASLEDLERVFDYAAGGDPYAAAAAVAAIRDGISILSRHPLIGRRTTGPLRELVISFGKTGFLALYRFRPERDQIRILAIRHQRELDYPT